MNNNGKHKQFSWKLACSCANTLYPAQANQCDKCNLTHFSKFSDLKIFPECFRGPLKTLWQATCGPWVANSPLLLYSINNLRFTKIRVCWNGGLPLHVPDLKMFLTLPKFEWRCFNWPKFDLSCCNLPKYLHYRLPRMKIWMKLF